MKRPRFLAYPDPEGETLYPVEMPGRTARRRIDRRNPNPPPPRPLIMYFSLKKLRQLRVNVAKAIMKAQAHEGGGR